MHPATTRRAARVLVAALVAALPALAPAGAVAAEPALALALDRACAWVMRGVPTTLRLRVGNPSATDVEDVRVVPRLPAGWSVDVLGDPATLKAGGYREVAVRLTAPADAALGAASLAFDAVGTGVTAGLDVPTVVVDTPAAPTGVVATPGDGVATVSWQPGPWRGRPGDQRRVYWVTASPGGARTTVEGVTSATVAGLANGTAYTFTVTAWSELGETASAPSEPVTPAGVPGPVTGITVSGSGSYRWVSWEPAAANGAEVTGYTVTAYPGGSTWHTPGDTTTVYVDGLDRAQEYDFTVTASNAIGSGPESEGPHGLPAAFDGVSEVSYTDSSVGVTLYDDTPDPATSGWYVRVDPLPGEQFVPRGGGTVAWTQLGAVRPGTTLAVAVLPVGDQGYGPLTAAGEPVRTRMLELPPVTAVTAVPGDGRMDLCFAGVFAGGEDAVAYAVFDGETRRAVPAGARTYAVTGLANGTGFQFQVEPDVAFAAPAPSGQWWGGTPAGPPPAVDVTRTWVGDAGSLHVSWAPVPRPWETDVEVVVSPGGRRVWAAGDATTVAVDGLTAGEEYAVTLRSHTPAGAGPAVTTPATLVYGKPGAVPGLAAAVAPDDPAAAVVSWQPADPNHSPVTGYVVEHASAGAAAVESRVPGDATSARIAGLRPGVTYAFTVRAENAAGAGEPAGPVHVTMPVTETDTTPPVVTLDPLPVFTTTHRAHVTWSSPDAVSYDLRHRLARYDGGFGAYRYPAEWQGRSLAMATAPVEDGWTSCFSVRGRDDAGNVSAWTAERCTAAPLDDRALAAERAWARSTGSEYYTGTVSATTARNADLTATGVRATRLGVLATRCPACGTIGVYVDGVLVAQVPTKAAGTAYQVLHHVDLGGLRAGTVTLRSLSGRVHVDGLGATRVS